MEYVDCFNIEVERIANLAAKYKILTHEETQKWMAVQAWLTIERMRDEQLKHCTIYNGDEKKGVVAYGRITANFTISDLR